MYGVDREGEYEMNLERRLSLPEPIPISRAKERALGRVSLFREIAVRKCSACERRCFSLLYQYITQLKKPFLVIYR